MKNKVRLTHAHRVATITDWQDPHSKLKMVVYQQESTFYGVVESKPGTITQRSEPMTLKATDPRDAKDEAEALLGVLYSALPKDPRLAPPAPSRDMTLFALRRELGDVSQTSEECTEALLGMFKPT